MMRSLDDHIASFIHPRRAEGAAAGRRWCRRLRGRSCGARRAAPPRTTRPPRTHCSPTPSYAHSCSPTCPLIPTHAPTNTRTGQGLPLVACARRRAGGVRLPQGQARRRPRRVRPVLRHLRLHAPEAVSGGRSLPRRPSPFASRTSLPAPPLCPCLISALRSPAFPASNSLTPPAPALFITLRRGSASPGRMA